MVGPSAFSLYLIYIYINDKASRLCNTMPIMYICPCPFPFKSPYGPQCSDLFSADSIGPSVLSSVFTIDDINVVLFNE